MRTAFIDTLYQLAQKDDRIILMTGDLGFGVVQTFQEKLPKQFVNAGVAEQNMTTMAAGMALSGKIVFTYSIANFPVLRCLEQIRNDVCYHHANVKIVSVGAGMAYGSLGISHHATEDLAVMRTLPNITVVAPGDPIEAGLATRALIERDGPGYLRLGRAGEPRVHPTPPEFEIGKAITVVDGFDLTLVSTGSMLASSVKAAELLAARGIQARVLSMHTIKPLDGEALFAAAGETAALFTVEEHSIIGGLGGAVAEFFMESPLRPRYFKRIGLNDVFTSLVGDQEYLHQRFGLDPASIVRTVLATVGNVNMPSRKRQERIKHLELIQ